MEPGEEDCDGGEYDGEDTKDDVLGRLVGVVRGRVSWCKCCSDRIECLLSACWDRHGCECCHDEKTKRCRSWYDLIRLEDAAAANESGVTLVEKYAELGAVLIYIPTSPSWPLARSGGAVHVPGSWEVSIVKDPPSKALIGCAKIWSSSSRC